MLLLQSCDPTVTFDEPQPANTPSLKGFPRRLQGEYLSRDKASVLTISEVLAIRTYNFSITTAKDSIKDTYRLDGDTLTEVKTNVKQKVIIFGDSIFARGRGVDTIFQVSDSNVLKKYKGYYFLNTMYDKNAWTVKMVSLTKGLLTIAEIADSAHLDQLKEITETPADTICTNFKLNQAQFNKFIKQNGFDQVEQFVKIK